MGFSESIAFLKGVDGASEHVEAILAHESNLKNESISHRKKAGEYAPLAEKLSSLTKTLADSGFNLDSDIAEQIAAIKGGTAKVSDEASRKLSNLEKEIAGIKAEKEQAVQKAKRKSAEAKLLPGLNEHFYNAGSMFKALLSDGMVDFEDEDNPRIKIGESVFDISEGLSKLKEHSDFKDGVKNIQAAGGGSNPSAQKKETNDRADKLEFIKRRSSTF